MNAPTALTELQHAKYRRLVAAAQSFDPVTTAVAHPCDRNSLEAVADAAKAGLVRPILVGPRARIEAVAREFAIDISGHECIDAEHSHAAAAAAVALVREGRADALMKGSLHTDELM